MRFQWYIKINPNIRIHIGYLIAFGNTQDGIGVTYADGTKGIIGGDESKRILSTPDDIQKLLDSLEEIEFSDKQAFNYVGKELLVQETSGIKVNQV